MRDGMKRILSFALSLVIVCSFFSFSAFAKTSITLEELMEKYPHGTYWNGGDPETYTLTPCDHHYDCDYRGGCYCNSFRGLGIQCLGFAYQIATLIYGGNQYLERAPIYDPDSLDNLKAGDIVRFRGGEHSIFITAVDGDIVTYADCNSDHQCVIRWNQTILKSTIKASFTYLDPAPYTWVSGGECDCSRSYDGNYRCIVDGSTLNIRSGHGTSHSIIGSIPDGAIVYVSKANGEWAHVYYNGINGYASMQYLELQHSHSYKLLLEQEHPHREYYLCDCGEFYYTGFDGEVEDCDECKAIFCEQNGHGYTNDCDPSCDYCGALREVSHLYDNACDEDCNLCSEPREAAGHVYDNGLDKDCNECGAEREVAAKISGDVNGDKEINGKDFALLRQFLNDWDVSINRKNSDVNADGKINGKDMALLRQYLNDWDVELI